ncbi:MAG: hypothetical protein Salg2KO_06580 [Salibacteraceae bacterium]
MREISLKIDYKFFVSWLVCTFSMFGLSYAWHGLVLNDFMRISYPLDLFLVIAAFVYLAIGLGITTLTYIGKRIKNSFRYGILVGGIAGALIYAVAFLLGLSFYTVIDFKIIAFDFGWQCLEQGVGGLVCGWVYRFLYQRSKRIIVV